MIDFYYKLVVVKKRTCNDKNKLVPLVPAIHRKDVLDLLTKNGYDADGNIL